jgi:AraC family transcriptional regulator
MVNPEALTILTALHSSLNKSGRAASAEPTRSSAASGRSSDPCGFTITDRSSGKPLAGARFTRRDWKGGSVHLVRFDATATYDFRFDAKFSTIVLLDLYRTAGDIRVEGQPRPHVKDLRDRLTFASRDCDFRGWSELGQASSFLAVRFTGAAGNELARFACQHGFDDHALRMMMGRLKAVIQDPSLDHAGYVDTLCDLVLFELKRALSIEAPALKQGGLTDRQVRLVTDYMDAHLLEKVTVADLAGIVGLTRFHFIRAFKESVGLPPHQVMIRKRIDRAKDILSQSSLPIGEVADRSGFRGTQQLTRAFRQHVGVTPTRFRREHSD